MNSSIRHEIFTRFKSVNPHPTTELEYRSTFELLIAVILSAQATDKGVNVATRKLFPTANTPEKILDLGEAGLGITSRASGYTKPRPRILSLLASCSSSITAARCRRPGKSWKNCRAWGARPPT